MKRVKINLNAYGVRHAVIVDEQNVCMLFFPETMRVCSIGQFGEFLLGNYPIASNYRELQSIR